jgi:hypothetical protein
VSYTNTTRKYDAVKESDGTMKGKLYLCTFDADSLLFKFYHFLVLHLKTNSESIFISHHFTSNGIISRAKFDYDKLFNPKCWLDLDFVISIDELDAVVREFDQRYYEIWLYNHNSWIEDVLTKLGFPKGHRKNCGCGLLSSIGYLKCKCNYEFYTKKVYFLIINYLIR